MKSFFLFCFIISTHPLGLFSIRFDEYYDSEGSPMNYYPCFQIGSECQVSGECCGVACCVQTAWYPKPVCLVPGYKSAFADILYYNNISINDNLLNEFSSNSTIAEESLMHGNTNLPNDHKENDESFYCSKNRSNEDISKNKTSLIKDSTDSVISFSLTDSFPLENETINPNSYGMESKSKKKYAREFAKEFTIKLQKKCKFLLLDSTIVEPPGESNLSIIYETLKNSDVSKRLVTLLQEKLQRLNEKEMLRTQKTSGANTQSSMPTRLPPKSSKWDIVRQFFLEGGSSTVLSPQTNNFTKKSLDVYDKQVDTENSISTYETNEKTREFRELIDDFYTANELNFVSSNNEHEGSQNMYDESSDELLEFYNINLPYNIEQPFGSENPERNHEFTSEKHMEGLERYGSKVRGEKVKLNVSQKQHTLSKYIFTKKPNKSTTKPNPKKYFLSLPAPKKSLSKKISEKLTNMFIWHKKTNSSKKKSIILNERFLLTLNAKNLSKTHSVDLSESSQTDNIKSQPDEYYSLKSSSESASSETEDLYNNSIIFVMHKRNASGLEKSTKWDSVLNFFHIAKSIPCPECKNPCIDSSIRICTLNVTKLDKFTETNVHEGKEAKAKIISESTTPKIIYLPESLMPEALERRKLNNTEFTFYDESYVEDVNTSEDHNSTKGRFLFFFK